MSSPTVRSPRMNAATMMRPASSSMLRQPPAGAILRSQLAHLDDVRQRLLGLYPRRSPPLKLPEESFDNENANAQSSRIKRVASDRQSAAASVVGSAGSNAPSPDQPSLKTRPLMVSPSSPELYKQKLIPSSSSRPASPTISSRSSTNLVDLNKLRRGSSKLQVLSKINVSNKTLRKKGESTNMEAVPEKSPRVTFADIMRRRNHQLKLISQLEKEKQRGAVIREHGVMKNWNGWQNNAMILPKVLKCPPRP